MNYQEILKLALLRRKRKNPSYSLTSFARDLKVAQPHLSKILSGQRRLTPDKAYYFGRRLDLNEEDLLEFIVSAIENKQQEIDVTQAQDMMDAETVTKTIELT